MLAVCLMFGGATLVSAQQDQPAAQSETQTQTQDDKQQISVSELPESVTAKLESQDYSGWTVGNAYKKMDESNQEIYIVELKQGTETKKVKFDRDGNKIDKEDKADDANFRESEPSETQSTEQSLEETESTEQEQQ